MIASTQEAGTTSESRMLLSEINFNAGADEEQMAKVEKNIIIFIIVFVVAAVLFILGMAVFIRKMTKRSKKL
jgi:hypothetical protein